MSEQEIMEYVMKTPYNTNSAILKQKLQELSNSSGNSGIMAQADWAETDETSPGYIKNKPFTDIGVVGMSNSSLTLADGNLSIQNTPTKISCIVPIEMPSADVEKFENTLSKEYYADIDRAFQQGSCIYLKTKNIDEERIIQVFNLVSSNNIFTLYGKIIFDNLKEVLIIVKIPQN